MYSYWVINATYINDYMTNVSTVYNIYVYIHYYQLKHPYSDLRVKLDFTPDTGTQGSNTRGTFSVYCFEKAYEKLMKSKTHAK